MSDDAFFTLIFFGCVAVIVIMALIANEFQKIAQDKGYESRKYFWISFFLGTIGYMMVIALPDRGNNGSVLNAEDKLPDIDALPDL